MKGSFGGQGQPLSLDYLAFLVPPLHRFKMKNPDWSFRSIGAITAVGSVVTMATIGAIIIGPQPSIVAITTHATSAT
jgi:hypothetical protein